MPSKQADVLVGRRYLARGDLDQALELFARNTDVVAIADRYPILLKIAAP
jgi:hypothetical protein